MLLSALLLAAAQTPEPFRAPGDRPVDIRHLKLELGVNLAAKQADAVATLSLTALRPLGTLRLDAVGFEVAAVELPASGDAKPKALRFRHDGEHLDIDFPAELAAGDDATLAIRYRVRSPKDGLFFFGPTPAEPDIPLSVWSQGESTGNRHWIPCLDHPDERQTSEMVVTVPQGFEALSNGKLVSKKDNPGGTTTFHWSQEQSHVSYLVTLAVGQFAVVREEWRGKPVLYYVPKAREADVARTFGRTREMLEFFSKRFGTDYPWEKYAQITVEQFSGGGMENTSATTLTQNALHDERAFLDSDADGLIAHELAHQWWGDLLTCRDWAHLWLNEGFASYSEVVWDEYKHGPDVAGENLLRKSRLAIAGGKERPIVDRRYRDPSAMFDARAYPKGAWVLHMLRKRLGDDAFWRGIRMYAQAHKFGTVETADLKRALERASGRNLERFFHDWTERPGSPVLSVESSYLPESKQLKVVVRQSQAGEPFAFPLTVDVSYPGVSTVFRQSFDVTEREQTFYTGVLSDAPNMVQIDRDQTLLATFEEKKGRDWWKEQLLRGQTLISRVRAAEFFGKSQSPADRELLAEALAAEKAWGVAAEIAKALSATGGDVARDALIAGLSSPQPKIRRACAGELGAFARDGKAALALKGLLQRGDPSLFAEAAALRSYGKLEQPDAVTVILPWLARKSHNDELRQAAVRALASHGDLSALDALLEWTRVGKPRTVRLAAVSVLPALAKKGEATPEQQKAVVAAITNVLLQPGEMPQLRAAALIALREMGTAATPGLDTIEAILAHDTNGRVREQARKALAELRDKSSVPVEVSRLREELDRLRKANDGLQDRLNRLETKK